MLFGKFLGIADDLLSLNQYKDILKYKYIAE